MLYDNIKPNLNILRFVLDRVHTDIKINNSIETNHLYYKDKPIFSSYGQSYFYSLKMWKIISPSDSMEYTKSCTKKHAGGDKGFFQNWNTNFGYTYLDVPKSDLE